MTARERYDAMVRDRIAPELRSLGFRRARNAFRRRSTFGWQLFDFQASQFGTRHDVRFTINLGLAFDALRGPSENWDADRAPTLPAAHVTERIGQMIGDGRDHWWRLHEATDAGRLAQELTALLREQAIPWLDRHADPDSLLRSSAPDGLEAHHLSRLEVLARNAGRTDLAARFASAR